jgi:hypothetical protein
MAGMATAKKKEWVQNGTGASGVAAAVSHCGKAA